MEVSNEIKEEIRKTQTNLKTAIRMHQVWQARFQEDKHNSYLKTKVKEIENEIIEISQQQKLVVDRLRRELELYQKRLTSKNKQVNVENDNRYVAQQLRDHQIQYRSRNRNASLLKPSVLNEIRIKTENINDDIKETIDNNLSDSENEISCSIEKENSTHSESDDKYNYQNSYPQLSNNVHNSRNHFTNVLNKAKECLVGRKVSSCSESQDQEQRSESDSSQSIERSPTPSSISSPLPLPEPGEPITQDYFMRDRTHDLKNVDRYKYHYTITLPKHKYRIQYIHNFLTYLTDFLKGGGSQFDCSIGLVTPTEKELIEKIKIERRKRTRNKANRNDFVYDNSETSPRRKKINQLSYLQSHNGPPQTRSAKLKKQQSKSRSREGSPSGSSAENKGLFVEPIYPAAKKVCHGCGRNDVPSLLVRCTACGAWQHTGCAGTCCTACAHPLPEDAVPPAQPAQPVLDIQAFLEEKRAERKRLQLKNIQLCEELRKLEARAATLKENLDEHNDEKRQLLANQIGIQRNLQKLLEFIGQFKDPPTCMHSTSISETGSDISKINDD